jgi:uncharacterized protein
MVAYGFSLGCATAINAAGVTPAINGVVSLSAFSSWSDVFVGSVGLAERSQASGAPSWNSTWWGWRLRSIW